MSSKRSALVEIILLVLFSCSLCKGLKIKNTLPTLWYQSELDCRHLSWSDECNDAAKCTSGSPASCTFQCPWFKQSCFNNTSIYTCTGYKRTCNSGLCKEYYAQCDVTVDADNSPLKAPAPGVPAKVYPYCVPGIVSLRDHCNATLKGCSVQSTLDATHLTGRSVKCQITCEIHNSYCVNYTRLCTNEVLSCDDTAYNKQCRVEEGTTCALSVTSRTLRYAIDNDDSKYSKKDYLKNLQEYTLIDTHAMEDTCQECVERTEVPYNLECNYMGGRAMEAFAPVVFEGRAYDAVNGVRRFLSEWDSGYKLLCEQECWYHLIKRTRACWPKLPLQYFVPGSDYRTLELFIRNTTDMMCYTTPSRPKNYVGDQEFENEGNSCVTFFDPTHNLTRPHYEAIKLACELPQEPGKCNFNCLNALEEMKATFGCCIGLIIRQFEYAKEWLALVNFDNNFMLLMLDQCSSQEEIQELLGTACDNKSEHFVAVDVVKYMMLVIGGVLAVATIVMTVSFYWQLEHEPLKRSFYHF